MSFAIPSLVTGDLIPTGVTIPELEAGALVTGGVKLPILEAGALVTGGLKLPSLSTGVHALSVDLQLPSLVVGDFRDDMMMSVAVLGTAAAVQVNFFSAATSTATSTTAGSALWTTDAIATASAAFTTPVVGGLTMNVVTSSSAAFTSTGSSPTIFWEVVSSTTSVSGSILAQRVTDATVTGSVVLNGAVIGSASYQVSAASVAQILSGIQFVQDFWDGWAYNLNTGAPSSYENFKFNSFCRLGSNYYGCSDAGIFLLSGDTDNTAAINMTVTTGKSDLSVPRVLDGRCVKAVPNAYVTAKSAAAMTLTCKVEGQEYTYTFQTAEDPMASTRVDIGRGLQGTLWQFELKNQAGADAEIDSLTVDVSKTQRRR